jgi:hypothetical protein
MNTAFVPVLLATNYDEMDWSQLQWEYNRALGDAHSNALTTLGPVVRAMADRGATRKYLISLGAAYGYKKAYVSSLISQILVSGGHRQRCPGAGPKIHPLARRILAFAREEAGRSARKHLASAARLAQKEDEEQLLKQTATAQPANRFSLPDPSRSGLPLNFIKIKPPPICYLTNDNGQTFSSGSTPPNVLNV